MYNMNEKQTIRFRHQILHRTLAIPSFRSLHCHHNRAASADSHFKVLFLLRFCQKLSNLSGLERWIRTAEMQSLNILFQISEHPINAQFVTKAHWDWNWAPAHYIVVLSCWINPRFLDSSASLKFWGKFSRLLFPSIYFPLFRLRISFEYLVIGIVPVHLSIPLSELTDTKEGAYMYIYVSLWFLDCLPFSYKWLNYKMDVLRVF